MPPPVVSRTGLARALSKLGFCSRSRATELIRMGKVTVNRTVRKNPEFPVLLGKDVIIMDDVSINQAEKVYVVLNKPRGLVTSASDELGRETVFACFENSKLPHLSPVGRLDKASEGLLLFTNDNTWADIVTNPETHLDKNTWLEFILDEGRNRHIRRLLGAFEIDVLRLVRVAVGTLKLGDLTKGKWRHLSKGEVAKLRLSNAPSR